MVTQEMLKRIRQLRTSHGRRKEGSFIAEGVKLCQTLLAAGVEPEFILAREKSLSLFTDAERVKVADERELKRITELTTAPDAIGVFRTPQSSPLELRGELTVALGGVQNPGNLGTIARTANWFGIRQLLCSPDCAQIYSPKALQATMGAIARIRVQYANLEETLEPIARDFPIIALDLTGTPIQEFKPPTEGIILLGSEGRGIPSSLLALANQRVTIPPVGTPATDSLNVAIAAGILFASIRS